MCSDPFHCLFVLHSIYQGCRVLGGFRGVSTPTQNFKPNKFFLKISITHAVPFVVVFGSNLVLRCLEGVLIPPCERYVPKYWLNLARKSYSYLQPTVARHI